MANHYQSLLSKGSRYSLGALSLLLIIALYFHLTFSKQIGPEIINVTVLAVLLWLVPTLLTDKYVHKYPQRYFTYAIATHFKALIITGIGIGLINLFGLSKKNIIDLFFIMLIFSVVDFLFSLPRVRVRKDIETQTNLFFERVGNKDSEKLEESMPGAPLSISNIIDQYSSKLPPWSITLIQKNCVDDEHGHNSLVVIEDLDELYQHMSKTEKLPMIVCQKSLNNVRRLNNLLKQAIDALISGGYLIVFYKPLEIELLQLKVQSSTLAYPFKYLMRFIWYRGLPKLPWISKLYFSPLFAWIDKTRLGLNKNSQRRSLARAEVWGRLVYYGMKIEAEEVIGDHAYVIAKNITHKSSNKMPTYHPIVSLEKVGLNGSIIRLHKVRSMYAFSEFLQKDLYYSQGLTNTGKFKNDFRLTDYGPFIRKYWIDEIPGIYDWLRGDIKLVGMRATSPHYLSLYPKDTVQLYLQIKPGLVPPIFDENTAGFEQIVEIERTYLEKYIRQPLKTDLLYFWYTFRDIFVRKVRSK